MALKRERGLLGETRRNGEKGEAGEKGQMAMFAI
jgi:hypothetical protein